MAEHHVAVGGFVCNKTNEVLLVKSPLRGWEFPGGLVEAGETLPQALMREISDESGANVKITGIVGIYKNVELDIVNIDFNCEYESDALTTSDESIDVGWFSIEQAAEMITYPLYADRFSKMTARNGSLHCFSFKKDPFRITESMELPAGV